MKQGMSRGEKGGGGWKRDERDDEGGGGGGGMSRGEREDWRGRGGHRDFSYANPQGLEVWGLCVRCRVVAEAYV